MAPPRAAFVSVKEWDMARLEAGAWHWLRTAHLAEQCSPWGAWVELEKPIHPNEVRRCLAQRREALVATPLWCSQEWQRAKMSVARARDNHVRKIAYFTRHAMEKPLSIDVGIPSLGCFPEHLLGDGNHRFAGAILRGDKTVAASVCGSIQHARALGLWNPNACERELHRRWKAADQEARALVTSADAGGPRQVGESPRPSSRRAPRP